MLLTRSASHGADTHDSDNSEGLPIGVVITPGQAHDAAAFPALMQEIEGGQKNCSPNDANMGTRKRLRNSIGRISVCVGCGLSTAYAEVTAYDFHLAMMFSLEDSPLGAGKSAVVSSAARELRRQQAVSSTSSEASCHGG